MRGVDGITVFSREGGSPRSIPQVWPPHRLLSSLISSADYPCGKTIDHGQTSLSQEKRETPKN